MGLMRASWPAGLPTSLPAKAKERASSKSALSDLVSDNKWKQCGLPRLIWLIQVSQRELVGAQQLALQIEWQ